MGRPHGPDYMREQTIRAAKGAWTKYQPGYITDLSEFTVFASQLTGQEDLGVEYLPDGFQRETERKRIALHAAQVISEFGYCPTRIDALFRLKKEQPLVSDYWGRMEYEAREAAEQATKAPGASTEVGSAPGKSKGKKLFKD